MEREFGVVRRFNERELVKIEVASELLEVARDKLANVMCAETYTIADSIYHTIRQTEALVRDMRNGWNHGKERYFPHEKIEKKEAPKEAG